MMLPRSAGRPSLVLALVLGLTTTAAFAQRPGDGPTPKPVEEDNCEGCVATPYESGDGATSWQCPYELGPIQTKWSVEVTMSDPTSGDCTESSGSSSSCTGTECSFPKVSITLTNRTTTTKCVRREEGTQSGTPDPSDPPSSDDSDLVAEDGETCIGPGESKTISCLNTSMDCGEFAVCDVSYTPADCPTDCADGWGSCSIIDVFMICTECTESEDEGGRQPVPNEREFEF
ncbi:MAG: hypothetical protein AAF533_15770 [Acidobacteriota bacterium]